MAVFVLVEVREAGLMYYTHQYKNIVLHKRIFV